MIEHFDAHERDGGYSTPGGNPPGPTPNEIHREQMRKAREARAQLGEKESRAQGSIFSGPTTATQEA
jgi:hypothetical protein